MEYDLPKFISERVYKLQTSRNLILEIDNQPDPPPRPKPAKLKSLHLKSSSLIQVSYFISFSCINAFAFNYG